jgi:hypothetical protein
MALAAQVKGSADNIESVKVDQLRANTGFANLEASQPINVTIAGSQPTASGEIRASGNIESASSLLAVLNGAPVPFGGDFTLTQTLRGNAGVSTLAGAIDVKNFKVFDANRREQFAENQIAIRNDVNLDLNKNNATVNTLTVDMATSKALGVKFTGQVLDWVNARSIKGLSSEQAAKLDLSYDLAKLWPIIRPMLSPEMQEQYKTLEIEGQKSQSFLVWGAYPKSAAFSESIKSLNAKGGFALDKLVLPQGLSITAFQLPFDMNNGVIKTAAAEADAAHKLQIAPAAPGGQPRNIVASTAIANDGALNLANVTIDMTQPEPVVSMDRRHIILRGVKLNPILADSLGKIGAILLIGTTQAEGLLTVNVLECDRVPLGQMIETSKSEARFAIAVEDIHLNGVVPGLIADFSKLGTEGLRGNITGSEISLKNGVANSNMTFEIAKLVKDERGRERNQPIPMKIAGDMTLKNMAVNSQITLPSELIPGDLKNVLPNGVVLPLSGVGGAMKIDASKAVGSNLGNILGGGGAGGGNPLENILKGLGGEKKEEPAPPRNETRPRQEQPRQQNQRPR